MSSRSALILVTWLASNSSSARSSRRWVGPGTPFSSAASASPQPPPRSSSSTSSADKDLISRCCSPAYGRGGGVLRASALVLRRGRGRHDQRCNNKAPHHRSLLLRIRRGGCTSSPRNDMIAIMSNDAEPPWRSIFAGAPTRSFAKGSVIFRPGDPVEAMQLVRFGTVVLERSLMDGGALTLQTAHAGALIAQASLFAPEYHCDGICAADTTLAVRSRGQVLKALSVPRGSSGSTERIRS